MSASENIEPSRAFRVGEWLVEPGSGRIHANGEEVKLEPKVMEVLVYLAKHPGEVISHESLEAEIWAGTVVGYGSVPASIIKIRKALGDDSRNPRYIETVSKRGYRLIMPVLPVSGDEAMREPATPGAREKSGFSSRRRRRAALYAVSGLVVLLGAFAYVVNKPGHSASRVPSVLVLPFRNLGDDPREEHLSDGIADDLITDLSRIGSLRVMARQTSYYYKNSHADPGEIFRQLHVSYIVEGSVRKSGRHIRVNVQLSNAAKGESIWADRIDTDTENLFDVQDRLTRDVVKEVYATLSTNGAVPRVSRGTRSFDAYDAFLVGQRHAQDRSREGYEQTVKAYRRAIGIDANYARVYGAMAVTMIRGFRYGWSDLSQVEARERALMFARKAVALDQSTPQIYWSLGYVHLHRHEYDAAEKAARRSVALSPSYADGYALLANIANWRGKPKDAQRYVTRAMELNPYYSFQYPSTLGTAYYQEGHYQEAVTALKEAVKRNPTALNPHLYLAAAYTELGLGEEAAWEINEIDLNHSDTRISELAGILPYEHSSDIDAIANDLRKAGMLD